MTLTSIEPEKLFSSTEAPPPPARRIPYSPALDGFRGVAVSAVVLYHGGMTWATGGYLGVDAFFCLSGFLITSLLLAEFRDRGTVDLLRFWAHRARRLLPALFVMLVGIGLYNLFVAPPDVLAQLRGDGLATLFYVMNWRLIVSGQSYFDQFYASPMRHMWSLAIEEQYYLIWPLVTLGIMSVWRSTKVMLGFCLALAAGSALLMFVLYHPDQDPMRLYYGTDTRAQALLIGSATAAAVASGWRFRTTASRWAVIGVALVAAVILGINWVRLPATDPLLYRGGFTVFSICVAAVILACTQIGPNPIRSALAFEPLRRLGLISYGVYLYHWPIFAWLNADRTGLAPTSLKLLALRLAATLAVALASYFLLEKPIRQGAVKRLRGSDAFRRSLLPLSFALVLALLITSTAGAKNSIPTPGDFAASNRPAPTVSGGGAGADDLKVLLVGDSVAYSMGVGFEGSAATDNHIAVWNQAVLFCELVPGAHRENGEVKPASDTCVNWDSDWRTDVEEFQPALTVLQIGAWEIFDRQINGEWVAFGTPEYDAVLKPVLQKAVDALGSKGAPVVVLTTPRFERDDGTSAKEWTQNDTSRTDHFNALLRELVAANPGKVALIDLGEFLCPGNVCRKDIDGVPMRPDGLHFKDEDAKVVADWLAPQFRELAAAGVSATPVPGETTTTTAPSAPITTQPVTTLAPDASVTGPTVPIDPEAQQ